MMRCRAFLLLALVAAPIAAEVPVDIDWRRVATGADRTRLRGWRLAWVDALAKVQQAGAGAALAADPILFDPDRAMQGATLPAGRYRCRLTRLGGPTVPVMVQPWTICTVGREGAGQTFAMDGAQRTVGHLFEDNDARMVYLGTLVPPDERRPMRYARDARRDMAGLVKRIDARRWRLSLPYPAFGSILDVVDIVPATEQAPSAG